MTGMSALMPISGASAAVRIAPVPKPPIPPTTAAPALIAAMAAREGPSSSTSRVAAVAPLARHGARPPAGVNGDVGERRLRHLDDLRIRRPPLGEDLHV